MADLKFTDLAPLPVSYAFADTDLLALSGSTDTASYKVTYKQLKDAVLADAPGASIAPSPLKAKAVFDGSATIAAAKTLVQGAGTVSTSTEALLFGAAHGFINGDAVWLKSTVTMPTGISANRVYFAYAVDATHINLHSTSAGALANSGTDLIDITATGSGTLSVTKCVPLTSSSNIKGIMRLATGKFKLEFLVSLTDAYYTVVAMGQNVASGYTIQPSYDDYVSAPAPQDTDTCQMLFTGGGGTVQNPKLVTLAVIG